MYEEYASEGSAPAPAAAKSAADLPTTIRASRYVGKTTAAMISTSTYLIVEYADATSWIRHIGAVRYV